LSPCSEASARGHHPADFDLGDLAQQAGDVDAVGVLDLLAGDHRYGGGGFADLLLVLGGGEDDLLFLQEGELVHQRALLVGRDQIGVVGVLQFGHFLFEGVLFLFFFGGDGWGQGEKTDQRDDHGRFHD
jgi:hypothetical protein